MSFRPAFSFGDEAIRSIPVVSPIDDVTPDWAWGGSSGAGVRVAVIDSGIDAGHPAVAGDVQGYCAVEEDEGRAAYDTERHEDAHGHGTACAGIIRSLAPECELYSVKVLGAALMGRGIIFAAGLRWAIENGMHVCNLSLGTTRSEFFGVLHELADLAYFRRVMLVTAANNMPKPSFPSMYASVISVACAETSDPYVYYYNPEPPVEFGALGMNVHVAWKDGGWLNATGNSFATPQITGLVALILAKHPELTPFQLKGVLRALAANMDRAGA